MKFLKGLGWVFIPYIMLPFQWKKIGTTGKAIGTVWAIIALVIGFAGNAEQKPQEAAAPAQQSAPVPQTQPVSAPTPQTKPVDAPKPQATSSPAPVPASASQPAPQPAAPAPAENPPTISKAEFDKIKNGMKYEQVVKIIGGEGELLSEVGSPGDQFYTVMYMWKGEGSIGANANFTFQDGKLQAKAQMGLQ